VAVTFVGGASAHTTNGANVTITLPTSLQNDVVYVFGGFSRTATPGVSTSGYTNLVDVINGTLCHLYVGRKIMGATPDTSVTCLGSGNAQDATAYTAMVFRGEDTTTPEDATTTTANAATGNPDPPSITTVTNGAWVLAIGLSAGNNATITGPSGYSNLNTSQDTDTRPINAMGATKEITTAGAENPGAYSGLPSNSVCSASVAIRPAASSVVMTEATFRDPFVQSKATFNIPF